MSAHIQLLREAVEYLLEEIPKDSRSWKVIRAKQALAATEQPEAQESGVKIKRYDVDGEFVLYRDHIAVISALKQERAGTFPSTD
jgi:hypothetical protein